MIVSADEATIESFAKNNNIFVALGYFDGLHLGHQSLLKKCLEMAKKNNGEACVLLLEPHPLQVLQGPSKLLNLNSLEQRIFLIQKQGPFNVFILPFTHQFAAISPREFVENFLVKLLNVKGVVVGFNYTFGQKGLGRTTDLLNLGKQYGFEVKQVEPVRIDGTLISSTKIRQYIEAGQMLKAADYLGHAHVYMGKVVGGNRIGSSLGFPTANIEISSQLTWPAFGVYGGIIRDQDDSFYKAVVNVGIRPTIKQTSKKPSFEAHLLNYSGDLYNRQLQIVLTNRLRPEKAFDNCDDLKNQVIRDKIEALSYLDYLEETLKHGNDWQDIFFSCKTKEILI